MEAVKAGSGITSSPDSKRDNETPQGKFSTSVDEFGRFVSDLRGITFNVKVNKDGVGDTTRGVGSGSY
jgi:hypothetical protein